MLPLLSASTTDTEGNAAAGGKKTASDSGLRDAARICGNLNWWAEVNQTYFANT